MARNSDLQVGRREFLTATATAAAGIAANAPAFAHAKPALHDSKAEPPSTMAGKVSAGYWAGESEPDPHDRGRIVSARSVDHDSSLSNRGALVSVRGLFGDVGSARIALDAHYHVPDHVYPAVAFRAWSPGSNPSRFFLPAAPDGLLHLSIVDERTTPETGLATRMLNQIVLGRSATHSDPATHACRLGHHSDATVGALREGTYFIAVCKDGHTLPAWDDLAFSPESGRLFRNSAAGPRMVDFPYFHIVVRSERA